MSVLKFAPLLFLWLWPTLVWGYAHPYFSKRPQEAKRLEVLLQKAGLQALKFQPADLSITLQDVKRQPYKLSQQRGNVLLLTRWATWCGACKAELPQKINLHRVVKHPRFAIVGISDESPENIAQFESKSPAVYPISLIDSQGLIQKFFPSSAIPFTILVDGWGWILAMKRGGAAWSSRSHQALMRYLISVAPSPQDLKEKAPAPKVSFPDETKALEGEPFSAVFSLSWIGESDKYSRISIRIPKEKGLELIGVQTSGVHTSKGANRRNYTLRLKATQTGTYHLDPIILNYWLKDYDQHFQTNIGAMALNISQAPLLSAKKRWAIIFLGAAMMLVLLVILQVYRHKAKQRQSPAKEKEKALQERQAKQTELLTKLDETIEENDEKEMIKIIDRIYREVLSQQNKEIEDLRSDILYGGYNLSSTQRHNLLLELHRAIDLDSQA